jgi:hypothetical protein
VSSKKGKRSVTTAEPETKPVSIRMPVDLLEKASKKAKAEARTTTSLIIYAVMKYVAEEK